MKKGKFTLGRFITLLKSPTFWLFNVAALGGGISAGVMSAKWDRDMDFWEKHKVEVLTKKDFDKVKNFIFVRGDSGPLKNGWKAKKVLRFTNNTPGQYYFMTDYVYVANEDNTTPLKMSNVYITDSNENLMTFSIQDKTRISDQLPNYDSRGKLIGGGLTPVFDSTSRPNAARISTYNTSLYNYVTNAPIEIYGLNKGPTEKLVEPLIQANIDYRNSLTTSNKGATEGSNSRDSSTNQPAPNSFLWRTLLSTIEGHYIICVDGGGIPLIYDVGDRLMTWDEVKENPVKHWGGN